MAVQNIVIDLLNDIPFNVNDDRFADGDLEKGNLLPISSLFSEFPKLLDLDHFFLVVGDPLK